MFMRLIKKIQLNYTYVYIFVFNEFYIFVIIGPNTYYIVIVEFYND